MKMSLGQHFSGHVTKSVGIIGDVDVVKCRILFEVRIQVRSMIDEQMDGVLLSPFGPLC